MFTLDIQINGVSVGAINSQNLGLRTTDEGDELTLYSYAGHLYPAGVLCKGLPYTFHGEVLHEREDGILSLSRKILKDAERYLDSLA